MYFFIFAFSKYFLRSCNVPGIIPVHYSKQYAALELAQRTGGLGTDADD